MNKTKYIIEVGTDEEGKWCGKVTDETGNPVDSDTIYGLVAEIEAIAGKAANDEAADQLIIGKLYYYRGKHGHAYFIVDAIGADKQVLAHETDKAGNPVNDGASVPVYYAQRLILVKDQPACKVAA